MIAADKLFDLTGRAALVTGGNRGLGKAMAHCLAQAGANVVIASRHEEELRASADEIRNDSRGQVEYTVADLTVRDDVRRVADFAKSKFGKVDILINNSGANTPQTIDKIDDATWDNILELNLTSCMSLCRAVAPGMKERRWGRIIHISSIMGLASASGRNIYSATKSALLGLARASALDLGPFNITVNCIAPGPFLTEMPLGILNKEQQDFFASRTALGRWAEPAELAGPALLLASEAGSYITGTVIVVDGGCLAKVF
jgi:NAD(P)-dependent dehydrogenase (short-subunit alcohol dehydrogenase family)